MLGRVSFSSEKDKISAEKKTVRLSNADLARLRKLGQQDLFYASESISNKPGAGIASKNPSVEACAVDDED